jgi:hypothetical protein
MAILILCTKMLDQSNLSIQRCRLILWVECNVGVYLVLAKTIRYCHFFLQPTVLVRRYLTSTLQNSMRKKIALLFGKIIKQCYSN